MKQHQILCPVDYSEGSAAVLQIAANLAQVYQSHITLLNVTDPASKPLSIDEQQANQAADKVCEREFAGKGIKVHHLTLRGNPSDVIVEYGKKHAVDLIVMGTHGRSGLAAVVTGSVAKSVMAGAECTVVTVKVPRHASKMIPR
jgi:nucleotide-binding universal stress UspA family protein